MSSHGPTERDCSPLRGDAVLRAVTRATAAATAVLDPALVTASAADAAVRFLGARRADVWRFDGRRAVRVASAGSGEDAPSTLPACMVRIARGGLAQSLLGDELGGGVGSQWRRLLFGLDGTHLDVHALVVGDRVLGALTVVPPERGGSGHEAITIFAQQVAAALEKAEMHRSAQDAATAMRMQNRVLAELTDERDVPSLRSAVEQLVTEFAGDAVVSLLPVDSHGRLTVPARLTGVDASVLRVASDHELELVAPAAEDSRPILLRTPDLRMCASIGLGGLAEHETPEHATLWGVQLRSGDRCSGVLLVALPHDGTTPAESIAAPRGADAPAELLRALAPAVSIALENAQLFAREHLRASRLAAANDLARAVTTCSTRDELAEALVRGVRSLFAFARTALFDSDLRAFAEDGAPAGRIADRERALVSTSLHRRRASRVERPDRTCHAFPLVGGDRIHAVLYAEQLDTVTPEQETDDLVLLASVCEHAAACLVAIEATERLERNYMDTIQALVHALEARDQYTAEHSDVVAAWALETGRRLGMDDASLRDLELGAILHDIGKVAVPDRILNKPGRLTEDEFEVMKSHTVIGERILEPIGFLANVAPIVRYEHERWDGRGYPDGISGDEIPLASRIIFVCDAYHAITSDRPYRKSQSHAFARRIITENAGTQFDPAVVSVFLDVIDHWCIDNDIDMDGDIEGEEVVNGLGAPKDIAASSDAPQSKPATAADDSSAASA